MTSPKRDRRLAVLVIEADDGVRRLLSAVLARSFRVRTVADVAGAGEAVRRDHFDVVVFDGDTCDLAEFDADLPLVITTTAPWFAAADQIDLRCAAKLSKPFSPAELTAVVERAAPRRSSRG